MILETLFNKTNSDCFIPIDISDQNTELTDEVLTNPVTQEKFIHDFLQTHNKSIAYGGYLEVRNLYKRSTHFNKAGIEPRTIHLGVDCWCVAGTSIYTPFEGKIHSYRDNVGLGNYGPTIIVEHSFNGSSFFSLYGHLSLDSLSGLAVGKIVKQGSKLACLGNHFENGSYAPHLHFQLIKNIGKYNGDYPGVCARENVAYFQNNCPNPLTFSVS